MKEQNNNITDQQIRELLKKHMLEADEFDPLAEQLLEEEAKLAFGADIVFVPAVEKERQLFNKKTKYTGWYKKIIFAAISLLIIITAFFIYKKTTGRSQTTTFPLQNNSPEKTDTTVFLPNVPQFGILENDTDTSKAILNKNPEGNMQVVKTILKENADCSHAIYITDSVIFSPHSPVGHGNELEIKNHPVDDPMYFEEEHNTVWYKYVVSETGQLTFDIIPVNQNDDYDFMLYKWDGGDFRAKLLTDKIKPVRACISRNDKKLNSMTGLKANPELPSFIHSGEGASYVRHIDVNKGDVYYLLVDNVYPHGNGHTIKFHLQMFTPDEIHVGQTIVFQKISFLDGDIKFRKGSDVELDSLYHFLVHYSNVRIEIDGYTNMGVLTVRVNGIYPDNMQLSRMRAEVIAQYLVKRGIDPGRLTTKGYGYSKPIIKNPKTIKENKMNVRAEIVILSLSYHKDAEVAKTSFTPR